jgi:hypothetical protein
MTKVQEIVIDGVQYRVRQPRLREYLESKKHPPEDLIIVFLAGMILDEHDKEIGRERILDIPLAHFNQLSMMVNDAVEGEKPPLEQKNGSSSDLPSPSGEPLPN